MQKCDYIIIILMILQYYTDPTCGYTFRTLKSALAYLETGKVPKRAFIQKTSVHDIYSFDKCAELVQHILYWHYFVYLSC